MLLQVNVIQRAMLHNSTILWQLSDNVLPTTQLHNIVTGCGRSVQRVPLLGPGRVLHVRSTHPHQEAQGSAATNYSIRYTHSISHRESTNWHLIYMYALKNWWYLEITDKPTEFCENSLEMTVKLSAVKNKIGNMSTFEFRYRMREIRICF